MLDAILEPFVVKSLSSLMLRGLMESVLTPDKIDLIFEKNATLQYTRELLFSSWVDLISTVVCGINPLVNAAYRASSQQLNVSSTAAYDKLNGVKLTVSAAIVSKMASKMASLIKVIEGKSPQLLAPYRIQVIDGNCLVGTDPDLEWLRIPRICGASGTINRHP
jgi:hypothetical protein